MIAPLLPSEAAKLHGGRPQLSDQAVLNDIFFVLHTGINWEHLPKELGWGSGMTCWRRLLDWHAATVAP
jgi:transposase